MIKNLKKLRTEKGVSQRALGEAIGVSQQSINKYENYEIEPDIRTLILIARYFDTSVDYLIGNSDVRRIAEETTSFDLNAEESTMIEQFRQLNPDEKYSLQMVAGNYIRLRKQLCCGDCHSQGFFDFSKCRIMHNSRRKPCIPSFRVSFAEARVNIFRS